MTSYRAMPAATETLSEPRARRGERDQVIAVLAHQAANAPALAAEHQRDGPLDSRPRPSARCRRRRSPRPRIPAPSAPPWPAPRCRCAPPSRARARPPRRGSRSRTARRCGARAAARRRRPRPRPCAGWRPGCAGPRRRRAPRPAPGVRASSRSCSRPITGFGRDDGDQALVRNAAGHAVERLARLEAQGDAQLARRGAMASEMRWLRRPLTTSSRSKCRVPAPQRLQHGVDPADEIHGAPHRL